MLLNIQKNLKIIFKQKDNHYINNKVNLIKPFYNFSYLNKDSKKFL